MQISRATMLGTSKCMRPSVAPAARPQSRRSVMVAAHQKPHEGIMKAALIAAAASQLTLADPSYALGNIGGIEPNRNRTEDYKARNAMDAAENKGPAVQDRPIFAPDPKGSSKLQQGARGEFGNTSPTSPLNERATGSSKDMEKAENAVRNFPTAFGSFDLSSLQVNVGTAGSTSAEGGKQIGGGTERDAFDLKGPGSNQNRAAEIQKLKPNPGKAVENVKEKIKSVLPTANVFDPASLQVNVAGTMGQGGGDSARSKESLKNSGLIGGGGSSAAAQGPSESQSPAQGAQNLAQQAEGLNPGKAVESVKEKIKSVLPTANVFDPASLQVNVASSNPDAERRAQELKNSGITTGLPAPLAGDNAIPIKGSAVPNKDTTQGRRGDDQAASKGNRIFPTSSAFDASRLQVNVGLFDQAKEALSNAQDSLPGGGAVDDAKQAASGTASELKSKAGEVADVNGGALLKELQDSKNKAPYVQPGPVRATPDILNLDEPGKVIRENASKLASKVSPTSAPAMWGSSLQVNVGYGAAKGARPSDLEDGLSGAVKDVGPDQETIVNAAKEGNAGAVANEFGAGEQGAKSGSDGTRPRSTETSDFRAGAADQSPEARFGAPTAIAKKISGQETV